VLPPFTVRAGGPTLPNAAFVPGTARTRFGRYGGPVVAVGSTTAWSTDTSSTPHDVTVDFLEPDGGEAIQTVPLIGHDLVALFDGSVLVLGQATSTGNNAYRVTRTGSAGDTLTRSQYFPRRAFAYLSGGQPYVGVLGISTALSGSYELYRVPMATWPVNTFPMTPVATLPCGGPPSVAPTDTSGGFLASAERDLGSCTMGFLVAGNVETGTVRDAGPQAQSVAISGSQQYALLPVSGGGLDVTRRADGGFVTLPHGQIRGSTNGGPLVVTPLDIFVITTWNGSSINAGPTALSAPPGQKTLVLQFDADAGTLTHWGAITMGSDNHPDSAAWIDGRLVVSATAEEADGGRTAFLFDVLR